MSCIYLHTPRPLPFLLALFNLFLLDGSLKLERSPFKLQTTSNLFFEHIYRKLKGFHLKFHVFFVSFFMNDVDLKPSKWNGSPCMKIHEIFGWNTIHPWNVVHSALKNHLNSMDERPWTFTKNSQWWMNEISLMKFYGQNFMHQSGTFKK